MFAELSLLFNSVICCRMLPVQKSQAVKMIKFHLNKICLAVGDGGNDVSMIK
jgi:P-type E1-E2 ATPase